MGTLKTRGESEREPEDDLLALEQAQRAVRDLPIPSQFTYSIVRAAVCTAVVFAVFWWLRPFSPWWALLVFPLVFVLGIWAGTRSPDDAA